MKKGVKTSLKVLGVIVIVLVLLAIGGWLYLRSAFLEFEGDYPENTQINEITVSGHTFRDLNGNGALDVYEDERRPAEERIDNLLSQMTMEEKIHLLKGSGISSAMGRVEPGEGIPGAVGTIVPTPRLGIPTIYLSDGPAGLRIEPVREGEDRTYYATAFPIGTLLASTWNTELVYQVGNAMGNEAKEYGLDVILGPGANIHRHPFCGRNFEYYSEDPVLTGYIGAAMVNGIESNGIGTSVKHYVANNQETNRNFNDAIVSDRAMREIYLKGFEIIVKQSQPWTIMSSYNKVNGTYVAESRELLTDVLRNDWGFQGLVMSDWFGGNDAVAMIKAGNDLLEPGTKKQWNALIEGQENGTLSEAEIDTSVRRILELVFKSGNMKGASYTNDPDLTAHAEITRNSAAEGMVLLKNNGVLPLKDISNIALLGVTSYDFIAGGTGSGDVNEAYSVSLEEGLRNTGVNREEGFSSSSFKITPIAKEAYDLHKKANAEEFVKPEGINAMFEPYNPPELTYTEEQMEKIAAESDAAIITIGRNSGEGGDRREKDDFLLKAEERAMLGLANEAFHKAGKPVVVVLNIGGVIETASWKSLADAILLAWQGGQEGGNSVADILSGKVNPSGKLPMTFPVKLSDHASHANFPLDGRPMSMTDLIFPPAEKEESEKEPNVDFTVYEEGIYVGYRHFDKAGLEVSYPFGYGLSYTTFELDSLSHTTENGAMIVKLAVRNTGEVSGKEVVQLYVGKSDSGIDRPEKELKAFTKTRVLAPGESTEITMNVPLSELSYWDEDASAWKLEEGTYEIQVGTSSRDIRLKGEFQIQE
ncbi:glycoside hydrolase family 3 C-terminal domain-containing protein [Muriicola sp.]|uniref:glycoside hydrolase family 3 C-terminal domain-containing protein n=1 Tax=Muriicola sp. TaxID=2020856 RepID=UPI00356824E6